MPGELAPPKRRSRWRRLLRWMTLLALLTALAGIPLLWLAWNHRVALTNRALAHLKPFEASIENFDLNPDGRVEARNVVLKDRSSGELILKLPKAAARLDWSRIASGRIAEITLEQPELHLTEKQLSEWILPVENTEKSSGVSASPGPFDVGSLVIDQARLHFTQNNLTRTEATLSYHADGISRDRSGLLHSGKQHLVLENSAVHQAGGSSPPLMLERLEASGTIRDGVLHLDEVELRAPKLHLTPALLMALGLYPEKASTTADSNAGRSPAGAGASSPALRGVTVARLQVVKLDFSATGFDNANATGLVLPPTRGLLSYEADDLHWHGGSGVTSGQQTLRLEHFSLESPPGKTGHLRIPLLELAFDSLQQDQRFQVKQFRMEKPDILWTGALREQLASRATATPSSPPSPGTSTSPGTHTMAMPWELHAGAVSINQAGIRIEDPALLPFHLQTQLDLHLASLQVNAQGWQSAEAQHLKLSATSMQFPIEAGQTRKPPFFELPFMECSVIPERWNATKHVQKLVVEKPVLRLRNANTPWLQTRPAGPPPAMVLPEPPPETDAASWWQQIHFDELTVREGLADLLVEAPKPVDIRGRLNIETQTRDATVLHHLRLDDLETRLPTLSRLPFPIASVSSLQATVQLPRLWNGRRIESLRIQGAHVEAGDALMSLLEEEDSAASPEPPAAGQPQPQPQAPGQDRSSRRRPWRVGQLDISQSSVTIANLVPGLPAVKFNLEYHATDTPLLAEDLARHAVPQRIELANLTIPSPYEPLRPVAELDTIFVHFTLTGLMNKTIDRVEIVSPTLYVGEDLFWYVDYYREYVNRHAIPAPGGPEMVANDDRISLQAATAVINQTPDPAQAAWSIRQLQVHSGKLVLAPKGKPLKGFGKPFPFDINTEVIRGTLEAELRIPSDVYTLEQYKLQFDGMRGHVRFNLPVKNRDNNLVETFEVDRIRWKELQTGKAFLTITYDSAGIYSKFGAEAYEGYINGEFNVYLNDSFTWDGWIGGKNVHTGTLTEKLFPAYFFMKGSVDATLIAQGDKQSLFQADGSFKNNSPGNFSITALNDAIKDLPGDWTALEKSLTQIGMETLRDFEYDHAKADFRLYDREGNGSVRFTGPQGSRHFEINVYDHRWTTDQPQSQPDSIATE